ncbi:MAG: hypothetical protein MJZ16_08725 [Bacteroidales bacterium]|nr:hypothetical protein [Bacteroidales bacterium]
MRILTRIVVILFGLLAFTSCFHMTKKNAGFTDEAYATVSIPDSYTIYYLSHIDDDYFYLSVESDSCELAVSRKDLSVKEVQVPPVRVKSTDNTIYEDDKWLVKYVFHGEYGHAMWFVDKDSLREYVYNGMSGSVHCVDDCYFIVSPTRVYCLEDPRKGTQCDSITRYEKSKDELLLRSHLSGQGVLPEPIIPPVICYDVEYGKQEDIVDSYYVADYALYHSDTTIVGSFVDAGSIYLLHDAKGNLALTKMDAGNLSQTIIYEYAAINGTLGVGKTDKNGTLYCLVQDKSEESCLLFEITS